MTGGAQRSRRRGWAEALVESQAGAGGTLCPLKGSRPAGPGCRDEPAVSRGMQGHQKKRTEAGGCLRCTSCHILPVLRPPRAWRGGGPGCSHYTDWGHQGSAGRGSIQARLEAAA